MRVLFLIMLKIIFLEMEFAFLMEMFFILIDDKKVIQFNNDGYVIHYYIPLKLIEKRMDKYLKSID